MKRIIHNTIQSTKEFFKDLKNFFASHSIKDILNNKIISKSLVMILITIFLLSESFAWLYDEYAGAGARLTAGRISHSIVQYDKDGNEIEDNNEEQTIIYESNMSNITVGSKFIEVSNVGTLDMEFSLAFSSEGTTELSGVLYYRLYEVTNEVEATNIGTYNTKLEAYAAGTQPTNAMEVDTLHPVKNMSLLRNDILIDTIEVPQNGQESKKIYRFDYGMYSAITSANYSNKSMSVHLSIYSSQVGVITAENRVGQIWEVQNDIQFREVLNSVVSGDTIKLLNNINIDGSININKAVNLDLNSYNLNITQDLIYDYVNSGDIVINASGYGALTIGQDFILNTPKSNVQLLGSNGSYDIVVARDFIVNTLQEGEEDGLYLDEVRIVKTPTGLVPIDMIVQSNTRITIGPDIILGNIIAAEGTTNIEVINNGSLTQMNFANMVLQGTYTKPQIYVYNLGEIYGVLGSYSILLPEESTPYNDDNPLEGNTKIIKGITSGDITVGGSENFGNSDIDDSETEVSVVPIEDESHAYIVYIKEPTESLQGLLESYFTEVEQSQNVQQDISNIEKLVIWTLNAQYFESEDFVYANSNSLSSLSYLNLYNSRVTDGVTNNKIPNNAFRNNNILENVILPRALLEIGDYAFSGVELGFVPAINTDEFNFVEIPSSVTKIGANAFDSSKFIKFASNIPPTIASNAFDSSTSRIFVPNGTIESYQAVNGLSDEYIYISANISDNRDYFVYPVTGGIGISYVYNNNLPNAATSLGIPNTIRYNGSDQTVIEIGTNSFREMNIINQNGVALLLPSTVTRINDYAFYQRNVTSVQLTNVNYIGKYAFYETNISSISANSLIEVGNHAFFNTETETLQINNVVTIGDYAFANNLKLYEASVGTVSEIGNYAFYNCPQMQRFYINNSNSLLINNTEEIDLTVGTDAMFSNWGQYIDGRLRMYVPDITLPSGKTVVSLYKEKFYDNSNYIYITGIDTGTYTHMAVPYDLSEYTVKTVTITRYGGSAVTGYEIISYQGADLTTNIPNTITASEGTKNVVSIGDGAYQNTVVAQDSIVSIESTSLINIGEKALKGLNIDHIASSSVDYVSASAFEESGLHYAFFDGLATLGEKAFYNCEDLYRVKLGTVVSIGNLALANTSNLTSVFFDNILRNVDYSSDAFNNAGDNIANRFRMYVPDQDDLVSFYKGIFSTYADYIYPTGILVGSYMYGGINYNIGEYSIREVTKNAANGASVTGMELIEYHGPDLGSNYSLPITVTPSSDSIALSYVVNRAGTWDVSVAVTMTNTSVQNITDWQIDVQKDGNMTGFTGGGITAVNNSDHMTFYGNTNAARRINAGATITVFLHIKSSTGPITDVTITAVRATIPGATTYDLISVGDNAFKHTVSTTGATINLSSDKILFVGKNAFANISGLRHVTFNNAVTLDNGAFESSGVTQVSFNNLNLMGNSVLKNANNLYVANLGKVQSMGENAITNAPYLYQVIFESPSNPTLLIDANVFNNISSSTEDRQRFYVTNGTTNSNEEYVDVYKSHFPEAYREYFYSYDSIVGNYSPSGLIDTIDIGEFSVKNVTINGTSGYEIVEYHGAIIDASYQFPTVLDLNDRFLSSSAEITATPWQSGANYVTSVNVTITNNGPSAISSWRVALNMPNSGEIVGITSGNSIIDFSATSVVLTNKSYNGTINAGESYTFEIMVTFGGPNLSVFVVSTRQNNANAGTAIISIGDYAFSHASFSNQANYNIDSDYLLNIGISAFENNTGIRNIVANNCTNIGNNAFNNAINLVTASFNNLLTLGNNAFRNNSNLIIINLGTVRQIGENAFTNAINVARVTFNNTTYTNAIDLSIHESAFTNFATTIGSRLRIYVPVGSVGGGTMVEAYQDLLPDTFDPYIYERGTIQGSYIYNGYDIGAYSVRTSNVNGNTGWIIIEYHGADISSSFSIPSQIAVGDDDYDVLSIGGRAFALVNVVSGYNWNLTLPSTVTDIGDYAFYQRNVYTLSANALVTVGSHAFEEAPALRTVTFESVVNVEDYAFNRCVNLTTVTLGTNVQSLGNYAFYNAYSSNSLTRININTETPPTIAETTLPARTPRSFIFYTYYVSYLHVYVPRGCSDDYENADYWELQNIHELGNTYQSYEYEIIDADTDYIKIVSYYGSGSNGSLTIPASFTISNVTYPIRQIAPDAFDANTAVSSITLGRNIMNIGNTFLSGNTNITNISVNNNNPYFSSDNNALYSKNYDTLIKVPNGKNLTNGTFTMHDNTKIIASGAFTNNTRLRNITIPSTIIAISERAFTNASNLNSVTFSSDIPPYLTGFEFLPQNANLTIQYPLDENNNDNYANSLFYSWYLIDS